MTPSLQSKQFSTERHIPQRISCNAKSQFRTRISIRILPIPITVIPLWKSPILSFWAHILFVICLNVAGLNLPLDVRCGPLLRYVWTDFSSNSQQAISLYTILMVTHDVGSDYSTVPTLTITGVRVGDGEKSLQLLSENIHWERGLTFWRWKIYVPLSDQERLINYSINGSQEDIGFWVPAATESMRIVFHTCNGNPRPPNPVNLYWWALSRL